MTSGMPRQIWRRFGAPKAPTAPRVNTYPIDFTRSLPVLRQLLAAESTEALMLERSFDAQYRRSEPASVSTDGPEGAEA